MSIFISASFELKSSFASVFTVSVFQTHVGQSNKNDQTGLFGDEIQALFLKIVFEIFSKISSCQIIFFHKSFHNLIIFLLSSSEFFKDSIHVTKETEFKTSCFEIFWISFLLILWLIINSSISAFIHSSSFFKLTHFEKSCESIAIFFSFDISHNLFS